MDDRPEVPADAGSAGGLAEAPSGDSVSGDRDAAPAAAGDDHVSPSTIGGWNRVKRRMLEHPRWTGVGALATIVGAIATVVTVVMGTSTSETNSNNTNKTGGGNIVGTVNGNGNIINNNLNSLPGSPRVSVTTEQPSAANPYHGGWGPDREVFSVDRAPEYPVLNSITDNPAYGDERLFVRIKGHDADDKTFSDLMRAEPGDVLQVYTYIQNDCGDGYEKNPLSTIHGLAAVLDNSQAGTDISFQIQLKANNTAPVFAGSTVITSVPSRLEYVAGSAVMDTGDAHFNLDDADFNTNGMLLGQFKQDGQYPLGHTTKGVERGSGYILFDLRVVAI
jgi:hypothetical protein